MAVVLKVIYLILLSFSLQLLTYIAVTTAQQTSSVKPQPTRLQYRDLDDVESFICQSTSTSPFNNHVIFGTTEMVTANGHHWCTQENRYGSQCIQLVDYGTASIAMCGEWRTKLRCNIIGEAIKEFSRNCARNFNGKIRVAGRVTFSWGYITVGLWRVPDRVSRDDTLKAIT